MSGHSKWNNIKHKKEKTDSQRARVFTKIGREIAIAVKEGGADPNVNSKLRDVVAKAKANNMPNDNISRSIAKASGELGNVSYEEIVYEGYGNGGVALMVETLTDNRNRTASDVRHLFDKFGNGLGTTGCVSYIDVYKRQVYSIAGFAPWVLLCPYNLGIADKKAYPNIPLAPPARGSLDTVPQRCWEKTTARAALARCNLQ